MPAAAAQGVRVNRFAIKATAPSEHKIQASLDIILRYGARPEIYWFAIPNAGRRTYQAAAKLKAEGMKAGVADLCFLTPLDEGAVAFLELKTIGGSLSVAQRAFAAICRRLGIRWATAKTLDEALHVMRDWNILRPNFEVL